MTADFKSSFLNRVKKLKVWIFLTALAILVVPFVFGFQKATEFLNAYTTYVLSFLGFGGSTVIVVAFCAFGFGLLTMLFAIVDDSNQVSENPFNHGNGKD